MGHLPFCGWKFFALPRRAVRGCNVSGYRGAERFSRTRTSSEERSDDKSKTMSVLRSAFTERSNGARVLPPANSPSHPSNPWLSRRGAVGELLARFAFTQRTQHTPFV